MHNMGHGDVLKYTREAFCETIALKISHLRRYIPKGSNPTLTGDYIEAIVRKFIRGWIGSKKLFHGTFYSDAVEESSSTPMQIDGIVYDPLSGPPIVKEDDFIIVHPVFCTSVIEIKTSTSSISNFENRLLDIYNMYFPHASKSQVMGVVIVDSNPEKNSFYEDGSGVKWPYHEYNSANNCPIFILFKEEDNNYTPFEPGIDSMIRAVFTNQYSTGYYL